MNQTQINPFALLPQVGVGLWEWNVGTDEVACTDHLLALHGLERGVWDGTAASLFEAIHPEDLPRLHRVIQRALARRTEYVTTYRVREPKGELRNIQVRGLAFERDEEVWVAGTCFDLGHTAHEAMLERWVASVAEHLAAAESAESAVVGVAAHAVERVSDWCVLHLAKDWSGDSPGPLQPVDMAGVERAPDRPVHRALAAPPTVSNAGPTSGVLGTTASLTRWPDETVRCDMAQLGIEWWIDAPVRFEGRIVGVLTLLGGSRRHEPSVEDQVAASRVAAQIGQALTRLSFRKAAEDAIASRDEVLAIVSHDLRNPLNTIHMAATVLRMGADESAKRRLDAIDRAVKRADGLIRDLLEVAKVSGGSLSLAPAEVPLAAVGNEIETLFAPQVEAKQQSLEVSAADGTAFFDRQRIVQAVVNLVGNAVRHTPEGGRITFEISRGDGALRFSVRDTGPGVPPDQAPKLFEPFWQARKARKMGGAGLGLAIARGIVDAHEGRIWVESTPGQGAEFIFVIPEKAAADSMSSVAVLQA